MIPSSFSNWFGWLKVFCPQMYSSLAYNKQKSKHQSRDFLEKDIFGKKWDSLQLFSCRTFTSVWCLKMSVHRKSWQKRGCNPFNDVFRRGNARHVLGSTGSTINITSHYVSLGAPLPIVRPFDIDLPAHGSANALRAIPVSGDDMREQT